MLTSVLKNDNLKKKKQKERGKKKKKDMHNWVLSVEGAGGGRFQTETEKGLSPCLCLLVWKPHPLGIPARTLCAVALTSVDMDDEHGDEFSAAEGGRAHTGVPGLGSVLGEHVQQELRDADEVDNLCDAKERSNDQGSAVRPFQEGHRPFLLPDLPGEKQHRQVSVNSTPPPRQESLWPGSGFQPPSRD